MGEDITCKVDDSLNVELLVPGGFDAKKTFKFMTHGFSSKVTGGKTAFVNAWMQPIQDLICFHATLVLRLK